MSFATFRLTLNNHFALVLNLYNIINIISFRFFNAVDESLEKQRGKKKYIKKVL